MRHSIFSVYPIDEHHGQMEYTAIRNDNGTIDVYVEVPKEEIGWDFAHLTIQLPQGILKESHGFSKEEISSITKKVTEATDLIMEYVEEQEGMVYA